MLPDPEFPPLLTGQVVAAGENPFAQAQAGAAAARLGGGDILWSQDDAHVAAALVLEPEEAVTDAVEMVPLMMVAIGDALGAIGPPNLAITYRWPTTLLANGGEFGKVQLHLGQDYAVLGFGLDLLLPEDLQDKPGLSVHRTALREEGCGDLDRTLIIEAIARHFLSWLDSWQQQGLGSAIAMYRGRMHRVQGALEPLDDQKLIGVGADGAALIEGGEQIPLRTRFGNEHD